MVFLYQATDLMGGDNAAVSGGDTPCTFVRISSLVIPLPTTFRAAAAVSAHLLMEGI